jgi:hypothetical protein
VLSIRKNHFLFAEKMLISKQKMVLLTAVLSSTLVPAFGNTLPVSGNGTADNNSRKLEIQQAHLVFTDIPKNKKSCRIIMTAFLC